MRLRACPFCPGAETYESWYVMCGSSLESNVKYTSGLFSVFTDKWNENQKLLVHNTFTGAEHFLVLFLVLFDNDSTYFNIKRDPAKVTIQTQN